MKRYDVVVIGGGISGLSLAFYCAGDGLSVLVLEKDERVGGSFHTHRAGEGSDFWLELGAHTCYNSYGNLLKIMEGCAILDRIVKREKVGFKMLVDDTIRSIPSRLDFMELLFSAPRIFILRKAGESVESYYSKIVGRKNYAKVFGPAFNAVISQRANDFPADAIFKKRPRRKEIFKSFTLTGGLQTIVESIASQTGIEVMRGAEVRSVEYSDGNFGVTVADGACFESGGLCLAVPPQAAAAMVRDSFPDLAAKLSEIPLAKIETAGVAVRKDAVMVPPLAGIIAADDAFYSAVSRDTVGHDLYRGFTFHFKPGQTDEKAKLKRMSEVLRVTPGKFEQVVTKENIVPSLRVGHESLVSAIDRLIEGKSLLVTGNYFSGMAIEDCVSRSLAEYQRLKKVLSAS